LSKRLTALLIDSFTGMTHASWGKLCIFNFQGLAVLTVWDSLWSSTHEGSLVPGWLMRLVETLLPWKSKDKKCCLYKTAFVAAPIWVLGDVIAKFYALRATFYRCTYKSQIYFLVHEWCISEETCLVISRLLREISTRRSTSKSGTGKDYRTTYRVTWGVLRRVPSSISTSRLCSDSLPWEKSLGNPDEQEDRKKGTLSNQPQLTGITPTALLGGWLLQPIKDMMSLGTDFETHAKWQGSVEELTAKDFLVREVRTIQLTKVLGTSWNMIKCKERLRSRPAAVIRQATINLYSWVWKSL
jgi:hypothetical protein